jgi:hypothetical protein
MTDTPCPFPRTYQRNAQFTLLKDYDPFAKDGDFIEVTEWYNGEGFDCHVSSQIGQQHCSWTWGEYEALVTLVRAWYNDDETCITFVAPATEEVLRIDKKGFHYRGQFIADAGEAHRLMLEFLKQNTRAPLAQPQPQGPTLMEIVALADEIEEEGLGQVDLIRRALARWGRPAAELEQSL